MTRAQRVGLKRLVLAAVDAGVYLVRRGQKTISSGDGVIRITMPAFELVGGTQIRGNAMFGVRDGKISRFEVSSELVRN